MRDFGWRHAVLSTVVVVGALLAAAVPVDATRGRAAADGAIIIWDGERDVSIQQGSGDTSTLAGLNLARIDDFAARVQVSQGNGPLALTDPQGRVVQMSSVRLLLQAKTLASVCGATPLPVYCSRKTTLEQAIGVAKFALKNLVYQQDPNNPITDPNDPRYPGKDAKPAIKDLPVIPFDLVPGGTDGIWRLTASDRVLVAAMRDGIGAANVRIGFTSDLAPASQTEIIVIEAVNLALPAGSSVATGNGPRAANVTCLASDPANSLEILACLMPVPPVSGADANAEKGLFRSVDGGSSWLPYGAGLSGDVRFVAFDRSQVGRVFVAAGTSLYRRTTSDTSWVSKRPSAAPAGANATAVAVGPAAAPTVFAAFDATLFMSTNAGDSWTPINTTASPWPGRSIRSITVTSQSTIYVDFQPLAGSAAAPILRSRNAGVTWVALPAPAGSTVADMQVVSVDPSNALVLYVQRGTTVYSSGNEGDTWTAQPTLGSPLAIKSVDPLVVNQVRVFFAQGQLIRRVEVAFVGQTTVFDAASTIRLIHAAADRSLLAATDGRLYRSTDGIVWTALSAGLPASPVSDLDAGAPSTLYAATSLAPLQTSLDSGRTWTTSGDRRRVLQLAVNPLNRAQLLAVFEQLSTNLSTLARSIDSGATWTQLTLPTPTVAHGGAAWAAFDPVVPGKLYASADNQFLSSTDNGVTWIPSAAGLTIGEPAFSTVAGTLYALGSDTSGYGLWKTINSGLTWTRLLSLTLSPTATAYVAHSTQAAALFVAEGRRVYRSTDGGQNWAFSDVLPADVLPALQIGALTVGLDSCVTCVPVPPVYAGTDRGVFVSAGGSTWRPLISLQPAGAPFSRISRIVPGTAVSFGTAAGVWKYDPAAQSPAQLFDNAGGYGLIALKGAAASTISIDGSWISLVTSQTTSAGDSTIVYRVDPSNLTQPRTGYLDVVGRSFAISQAAIGCTYALSASSLALGAGGGSGSFTVTTTAGCSWSALSNATYITLTSANTYTGSGTVTFTVAPNTAPGSRSSTIAVAGQTFTIAQGVPTLTADKTALRFSGVSTGTSFIKVTPAETVRLTQNGPGALPWIATSNQPWLVVSPASSSGGDQLSVGVQFAAGLPLPGTVTGTVTISRTDTLATITVTLDVLRNGFSAAPAGVFETPLNNSTGVTGSIAVTGWAVDDVGITQVTIKRDPVAGEGSALVFVGTAVRVDGARPDVVAIYPTLPQVSRAGWGYLLLTNFLPNLGNGTFKLYAIADDEDGYSTVLGSKTITCTNSAATAPFGAIDTPEQGGTVSGNVTNFGWVLSPAPRRADPPAGGTVRVVIDGAFIPQVPGGWTNRSDLTGLFPATQFPGIINALGVAVFDSTPLTNGVHTISWIVTDNQTPAGAAGIGSRYFTVSNGSGLTLDPSSFRLQAEATGWREENSWLQSSGGRLVGRRGFDLDAPLRTYRADANGLITIQSEELDRIELHVGAGAAGYLRVAGSLQPLPIGSHLDVETGVFTWQPGVAFVGPYDFAFVGGDGRRDVRVVLNPKGSNRVGLQSVIDVPSAARAASMTAPFVVAGWAADLDSPIDRGVDAVHVWAYRIAESGLPAQPRAEPVFLGTATYGVSRPDVAAVYGDRFLNTGYGIEIQTLEPGTYDIAVFPYSTVAGRFGPARVVRVTVTRDDR